MNQFTLLGDSKWSSGKISLYISSETISFLLPKSLVFFMGGLTWQQDLGKAGRSLETPMIHLQTSFQSLVSSCPFLSLLF